jgi:hypothetical protein
MLPIASVFARLINKAKLIYERFLKVSYKNKNTLKNKYLFYPFIYNYLHFLKRIKSCFYNLIPS